MNKVFLIGEVIDCKDRLYGDRLFINFTIETKKKYKDKATGEMKSWSDRHKCVYENRDFSLNVGDYAFIDGELKHRFIEKDQKKSMITEVRCNEVKIIDKPAAPAPAQASNDVFMEDSPF